MPEALLGHRVRGLDLTVATAASGSSSMLMADMAAGVVIVSGTTATCTLTVFGSHDGSTFRALYGFDGAAATLAVPADGGAMTLPDSVYPLRYVKLVSGTALDGAAIVTLQMKS